MNKSEKMNMSKRKKRIFFNIFLVIMVVLGIRFYIDNHVFEVRQMEFMDEEIPKAFDGVKIVHISDLHSKSYGKDNDILRERIDEISPDYIFMTGDMVNSKDTDFTTFYSLASQLSEKYTCYYILGNHELDLSNQLRKEICDTLESYHVTVLDNKMVELTREGQKIHLYGMWYNPKYYIREDFLLEHMEKIMGKAENGFNLLLTHNPDDFEVYANWGADLTFAGHVHGGMIRLPFVGGLLSPNRTLFPKYDAGLYEYQGSNLIVSKGMSRGATAFRLFNQPELLVITLKKEIR